MYNFGELKNNIAVMVQRSGDTAYLTEIGVWINLGIEKLYDIYDHYHELRGAHDFATVDGTELYYMPMDFEKPFRLYDITNDKKITIFTEDEYTDGNIAGIADADEAQPDTFFFKEVVGVKRQVAAAGSTLQAKSSAAETGSPVVRVSGYIDTALTIIDYEEITVTGTSATTAASPKTFYKILDVSKDEDTTGYLTLEDSSGNDLSILPTRSRVIRHKAFRFGRIPDAAYNMRVLYKKRKPKLVDDEDYPFIECDNYLIFYAAYLAMHQEKDLQERAIMMKQESDKALTAILTREQGKMGTDYQHKLTSGIIQAHRS